MVEFFFAKDYYIIIIMIIGFRFVTLQLVL